MTALATHPFATVTLIALAWGLLACLLPFARGWQVPLFWALVAMGVPMLGWLTYVMGPGAGVAGFLLGMGLLNWPPMSPRRKPRPARPGAPPTAAE